MDGMDAGTPVGRPAEDVERRWAAGVVEVRAGADGRRLVGGYAAVFGEMSEDLGGFREIIEPGFFDQVLGDDVRALWQHDNAHVLGRTLAGTLRLGVDERGLWYEAEPPAAQWAADALASIQRGDVTQSSFGFSVAEDRWENWEGQTVRRLRRAASLFDVSPVTFPAYPQTSATVQKRAASLRAQAEAESNGAEVESLRARADLLRAKINLLEVGS